MVKIKCLFLIAISLFSKANGDQLSDPTMYQRYEDCTGTICQKKGLTCDKSFGIKAWNYNPNDLYQATTQICTLPDGTQGESLLCCDKDSEVAKWLKPNVAKPYEFPFVVSIVTEESCTGSILSAEYVMTASHCVVDRDTKIKTDKATILLASQHTLTDKLPDLTLTSTGPNIMPHELYNPPSLDYDITILKLDKPIPNFNKYMKPIRLAEKDEDFLSSKVGMPLGFGFGPFGYSAEALWGPPLNLTKPGDPVKKGDPTQGYCNSLAGDTKLEWNGHICVGGYGRSGVGKGHSGGPLVCIDSSGKPYQCGVSSYDNLICDISTPNCAERFNYPNIYTRVSFYRDWIDKKMGGKKQDPMDYIQKFVYAYKAGQDWSKRQRSR